MAPQVESREAAPAFAGIDPCREIRLKLFRAPNEMSVEPICERRRGGCAKRARGDLTESIVEGERQSSRPTPAAKRPTVLILLGALKSSGSASRILRLVAEHGLEPPHDPGQLALGPHDLLDVLVGRGGFVAE